MKHAVDDHTVEFIGKARFIVLRIHLYAIDRYKDVSFNDGRIHARIECDNVGIVIVL